jgi:hypothetical protein
MIFLLGVWGPQAPEDFSFWCGAEHPHRTRKEKLPIMLGITSRGLYVVKA